MRDSTDPDRLDADRWPELLCRGVRGLLAHVVKHGVEWLQHGARAVEQGVESSRATPVELPTVEPVVARVEPIPAGKCGRESPDPRKYAKRPIDERIYWRNPPAFDLTALQRCILRELDTYQPAMTRADLIKLTGVTSYVAINEAVFDLVDRRLVELLAGERSMRFRLLRPAVATPPDD